MSRSDRFAFGLRLTSNTSDGGLLGVALSDRVTVSSELPETLGVVHIGIGEFTSELLLVDEAEVIGARSMVLQGHSEQRGVQLVLDGVEERSLGLGLNCSTC